ncbi:LuxR C-terminal-related transcriptional regulator [Serratia sp. NPDC078593]|uniref:LuxR C-terminal-related transcriptional regulator n=1 Tax=unclassified Serratia (in: enterobacteria) TaxID=2647522 RepID=UPI0037D559FB
MEKTISAGHFIFYDAIPWINLGLTYFLKPDIIHSQQVSSLNELNEALRCQPQQTVVMELYGTHERLYEGVRYILQAKERWPDTAWVVFTDVENYSILHLLATIPNISLVSKRERLEFILTGITSARYALGYQSPEIKRIIEQHPLPAPVKLFSNTEWQVLALMVSGLTPQRIATTTRRTYKTISSHKLNISHKVCIKQMDFIMMLLAFRKCA